MAVFYGVALESTTIAQEEKVLLLKDVEEPKKTEEDRGRIENGQNST
jgi:hypothetical protein